LTSFFENFTKGLRRRWLRTTVIAALLGVIFVTVLFSILIYSSYFTAIRTGMEAKARTATDFFANFVARSYDDYYDSANRYAQTFNEADRIELQFLGKDGSVMISTSGFALGAAPQTQDIYTALETGDVSSWVGRRAVTGERIMAVSAPLVYGGGEVIGIMRYVTSLRVVDRQVAQNILIVIGVGIIVLAIVLVLNMVFTRYVITPVSEITKIARRIAEGRYGAQIYDTYPDEIGDMVDSINEMSIKIAQTDKMQSEFISSVSHELRTPLTAITGWGETLIYSEALDSESKHGVEIILKEARRLTKMVEELLEFTRMEDGRFTLNIEQIDIVAELEDAIFAFREILRQDELEIDYYNEIDDICIIPGDAGRLKQVFFNIFDNALKYGREGKRIEIYAGIIDEFVIITVRDFGLGVESDELPNLKLKFYKGSNAKDRGSGIGLSVCEEIIKYHDGRLELANAQGGGFVATIILPMTDTSIDNTAI